MIARRNLLEAAHERWQESRWSYTVAAGYTWQADAITVSMGGHGVIAHNVRVTISDFKVALLAARAEWARTAPAGTCDTWPDLLVRMVRAGAISKSDARAMLRWLGA